MALPSPTHDPHPDDRGTAAANTASRRRPVSRILFQDLLLHPLRLLRVTVALVWTMLLATVAITTTSLGIWAGDHVMPRVWLRVVLAILGIRFTVRGAERIDRTGSYVYVSNHQSVLDGMLLVVATRRMPRFVGKRAIARLPVIGLAWRKLGHILIDRNQPGKAYATLEEAARRIGDRYGVYFAPEGTRSRDGSLGEFKDGAFVYAKAAGLAVVPVAVTGTAELWPPDGMAIRPGTAAIEFGEPITVTDVDTAREQSREWIAARLDAAAAPDPSPERTGPSP